MIPLFNFTILSLKYDQHLNQDYRLGSRPTPRIFREDLPRARRILERALRRCTFSKLTSCLPFDRGTRLKPQFLRSLRIDSFFHHHLLNRASRFSSAAKNLTNECREVTLNHGLPPPRPPQRSFRTLLSGTGRDLLSSFPFSFSFSSSGKGNRLLVTGPQERVNHSSTLEE